MAPLHEHVMSKPPGLSSLMASVLSRRYAPRALGSVPTVGASFGGSRIYYATTHVSVSVSVAVHLAHSFLSRDTQGAHDDIEGLHARLYGCMQIALDLRQLEAAAVVHMV